jgi:hypothetical protein
MAIFSLSACKKEDKESKLYNETIAKLVGKWAFVSATTNQHYSNADHLDVVSGDAGDYMDFSNNGSVNLRLFSTNDISKYKVISNTNLIFDDVDKFDFKILTETDLVLYRKTVYSGAAYKEETYTLKK